MRWHATPARGAGMLGDAPTDVPTSTAGPADEGDSAPPPPHLGLGRIRQTVQFMTREGDVVFEAQRRHGDVFGMDTLYSDLPVAVTGHPDHVRSLLTADPALAPSTAGSSPLRPIVGTSSVLTATGERHRRQRKLLMPSFHGDAIGRYREEIVAATDREISRWPVGRPMALTSSAQTITLDVIMSGVFGVGERSESDEAENRLRSVVRGVLHLSTSRLAKPAEVVNLARDRPIGVQRLAMSRIDRAMYDLIAQRRASHVPGGRHDVLSLLLDAEDEDGQGLSDLELRNELLTLVLAGHETTANSIAWTFERLLRAPTAYERLRDVARSGEDPDGSLDATIHEAMRVRPVVPVIGREVKVPWRLGEYQVPADTRVLVSILLLHHREDLYPDPFRFDPQRFVGVKPGTHTWLPFGGGIRRCLGSALAMEELRIVVHEIARRTDLVAPDPAPERAQHRNVTMIPGRGGRVQVTELRA
ncbi:cytochrome P450 [Aeromicrobium sp.]|uniref:cytochrome P450 n=1 Tax=Aeromicrobium sp. TaxID=1871063 RepID=UPI003D6BA67B